MLSQWTQNKNNKKLRTTYTYITHCIGFELVKKIDFWYIETVLHLSLLVTQQSSPR